jgi:serine/threonine-protein kinase
MRTALLLSDTPEYTILEGVGGTAQYLPTGHMLYIKLGQLIAQPFDLDRLEFTGDAVPVTEYAMVGNDGTTRHYGYSDAGTLAYVPDYGDVAESSELAWMSADGTLSPTALPPQGYVIPRVSPNGRRIAVSAQGAVSRDIWLCDLETDSTTRLSFDRSEDWHPIWTPDGKYVVYSSGQSGSLNIYMRSADGTGGVKRLTESEFIQWPHSWSGDGKELVFVERNFDTGYDIWAVPIDGSKAPRPLLQTPTNENNPDVSKDGRWIAYQSNESGQYEIYVQPFPGLSGKWQVSKSGGNQACWSRDGKWLYFRHGVQMLRASITTEPELRIGTPEVVFESDAVVLASEARNYDISADGNQFLVLTSIEGGERSTLNRELIIVENWFEELKRVAKPSE